MKEERIMVDRRGGQWKKYAGYGLTAFMVIAAAILLVFMFVRREDFSSVADKLKKATSPVIVGAVMAFLMNPIMMFFESRLKTFFYRFAKRISRADRAARIIAIIIAVLLALLLVAFLLYLLIPQLVATITDLVNDAPVILQKVQDWYYGLEIEKTYLGDYLDIIFVKVTEYVEDFVQNKLVTTATNILTMLATGVWGVIRAMYNIIIGLIFAIYMMSTKEKLAALSKKVLYATFKRKKANRILRISRACGVKFIGSIGGKAIDSVIIGLICFVAMTIMNLPYTTLISVIVGVTNIIPFFGPFIGAIPSAFLILIVNPKQCLYFLIMILILQQFDGNILTPKIVGNAVNLSPLWVLFSCTVFGSLWGVIGMLIGVPLMASIYMIVKEIVEDRLHSKGLQTATAEYYDLQHVDETEMFCKEVEVVPGQEPEGLPFPEPTVKPPTEEDDLINHKQIEKKDSDAEGGEASESEPDSGSESETESTEKKILDKVKGIFRK